MIAAIVNALGIALGGTAGTMLRARVNQKLVDCLMSAMGLVVVSVGVQGIVGSSDTMCLVVCLAIGAVIGQVLRIDEFIDSIGDAIFIGMGFNMMGITEKKINVPNLLPAILLPIAYVPLAAWIGGIVR